MAKVRAAYNYSYNYEGIEISFKKGEEFQLLTKSNQDWWQVRRSMEGFTQDIYVPAVYVKEINEEMQPAKTEDNPVYSTLSDLPTVHTEQKQSLKGMGAKLVCGWEFKTVYINV